MPRARLLALLLALAPLSGCGSQADPGAPAPWGEGATIMARSGLMVTYGMKRVQVRLKQTADQAMPAFANAQAVVRGGESIKLSADAFDPGWLSKAAVTQRTDYRGGMAVFLRNLEGELVGSGVQLGGPVGAEMSVEITPNTARATVTRSLDGNNVADTVVIRATPLEMASGYLDNLPGVERVQIEVHGPAYGDGREVAILGTLKAPNLSTYQWQPSVASGTYVPAKLAEPGTPLPFFLTTRAFDTEGHEVGVTSAKIAIVGTATVTIGVDEGR
jgi:hypothetical protein